MKDIKIALIAVLLLIAKNAYVQESLYEYAPYTFESDSLKVVSRATYELAIDEMRLDNTGEKREFLLDVLAERRDAFREMISEGKLITDGELYDYVQSVADKIVATNGVGSKRTIFLVKDETANAFNMGDDNVFIHLGLIYRLENETELAYVIAHELGHNESEHFLKRQVDYADLSLNDSIKDAQKDIMKKEYGHVTALNKLMIPWILASKEKSRECEAEADDFGYKSLQNSSYVPEHAIAVFDILENGEFEKDTTKFDFVPLLSLDKGKLDYTRPLRLRVGSSLGSFSPKEKGEYEDMLRTHPFSQDRKQIFVDKLMKDGGFSSEEFVEDTNYLKYQAMAEYEMIVSSLHTGHVDRALFYALQKHEENPSDELINGIVPFCFAYLGYEKKKGRGGKLISLQSPEFDDNYNELIYFLMESSADHCLEIAQIWLDTQLSSVKDKLDVSNPTLAIFDIVQKHNEDFAMRVEREIDEYYLMAIFNAIKREYYIK